MPLFRGLLVSSKRNFERSASSEIYFALVEKLEIEKSMIKVKHTGVSGLTSIKIHTDLDLSQIVQGLIELEKDEPFFLHCLKIKPIQKTTTADIELIQKISSDLAENMEGKFRITITKRHSRLESQSLIGAIASEITNPVDLDNPEWVLLVEILADKVGISAIKPNLIFSTKKAYELEIKNEENWFLD